jgi:DNA-binding NtrC family response regulator
VLVVEDEPSVRAVVRETLEASGYRILEALDVADAIRICEVYAKRIHLVLTDVVMPKMGGRRLAARAQLIRPEMKVLYMSGYTDEAIVHHGVLDASVNFIQKPFSTAGLTRKIRDVLDSEK